jgi:hypothetical protein
MVVWSRTPEMACLPYWTVPAEDCWLPAICPLHSIGPECRCVPGSTQGRSKWGDKTFAGVGVHIAARVMAEAAPAEVMVSRTVRDLVVGSDFRFEDRGLHQLKGVEGEWQLFALAFS